MTVSRAEEITSEVRKLVQANRYLQAQLQQSVPKKEYDEAVQKLQSTISSLQTELENTKAELKKREEIESKIEDFTAGVSSRFDSFESHLKNAVSEIASRLSIATVPYTLYEQASTQIKELQEKISQMVPADEYIKIKNELGKIQENSVPKEKYEHAVSKIAELEAALANSVPRSDFDELATKLLSITRSLEGYQTSTEGAVHSEEISEVQPSANTEVVQVVTEQKESA